MLSWIRIPLFSLGPTGKEGEGRGGDEGGSIKFRWAGHTILQMFSDFLRWTERKLRFQLMAPPPTPCCLEFLPTPLTPAPAVGSTNPCGCRPLDSQERRDPAGNGPGERVVIIFLIFNLHTEKSFFWCIVLWVFTNAESWNQHHSLDTVQLPGSGGGGL